MTVFFNFEITNDFTMKNQATINYQQMPACNKRFGEIGGEVIARISVCPLTIGDSPNCVQLTPQLRQAAGTLGVSGRHTADKDVKITKMNEVKKFNDIKFK